MIHYFCHKDKCFRIADIDKAIVFQTRNAPKNLAKFCVKHQKKMCDG